MLRYIYLFSLLLISFTSCQDTEWEVKEVHGETIRIEKSTSDDQDIQNLIAPYKIQLDTIMNEVLCYSKVPVTHYMPESPLGNFVADLSMETALANGFDADMCLLNHFGLRATLPKGSVTKRDAYKLMPFENELVLVDLAPEDMLQLFSYLKESNGHPISNLRIHFSKQKDRIAINGKSWDKKQSYRVLTTDYLAKGGDRMIFFKQGKLTRTGIKLRDAIIDHMTKRDTIKTGIDGRFFVNKEIPAPAQ